MKRLFALCLFMSLGITGTLLSGCGGGRASTDPVDEMPADQDLTVDPVAEDVNP